MRRGKFPELDAALFEWQQVMQKRKIVITGLLLQEKAMQFWSKMDIYKDIAPPKFSEGWLSNWKARYQIKKYTLHDEAGTVELGEEDTETMEKVQAILVDYERCDIYNMDETGLYWRKAPTTMLATEAQPGVKQNKYPSHLLRHVFLIKLLLMLLKLCFSILFSPIPIQPSWRRYYSGKDVELRDIYVEKRPNKPQRRITEFLH